MKGVTFRQLRVFSEVARQLSFVRAAGTLHLTPPAVTMQVKELEAHVGLPLFERQGRQVSLTTAGEYFLVYAKRLLATLTDADNTMARFKRTETGVLTIGLVNTAGYFLPRLLARFRRDHPGIELRMQVTHDKQRLLERLTGHEIDLAITGRPPKELGLRSEPFAAHPLVFVCPPGHPLLSVGHPPALALANQPIVTREPTAEIRQAMDAFLREQRVAPRVFMELSSNETIKQCVIAGLGVGFLSLQAAGLEITTGVLKIAAVEGTPVMRAWHVVHLMSRVLSPAAEAFRYFLLEEAEADLALQEARLMQVASAS
ncbi:MAG: LysR family transcriptional regulator [Aquabacterium sp.]|nr:LysR family transcriptional regulator [Aquabacterium sp.]